MAQMTIAEARAKYGAGNQEQRSLHCAWPRIESVQFFTADSKLVADVDLTQEYSTNPRDYEVSAADIDGWNA